MPEKPGDLSFFRRVIRPPHGERDELYMKDPSGHLFALIPEVHQITVRSGVVTVSPSIVCPRPDCSYHGFLREGEMS